MSDSAMADDRRPKTDLIATEAAAPAGGGPFAFDGLAIGVFLADQPSHRLDLGDGPRDAPLRAGEGFVLPPGAQGLCLFDADHRFVSVEAPRALLEEVGFDPRAGARPLVGTLDPALAALARLAPTLDQTDALHRETMSRALAAHAARLAAAQPDGGARSEAAARLDDARLRRAVDAVTSDPAAPHSLTTLAAEAAMSPHHFARAFKKAVGLSPLQFVTRTRLRRARDLIRATGLPIDEVAARVGYAEPSHFRRLFRREFGAAPSAFRD